MEHIQNTTIYSSKVHADIKKQIIAAFQQKADISWENYWQKKDRTRQYWKTHLSLSERKKSSHDTA